MPIHSFDILRSLYIRKKSSFEDLQELKRMAKREHWSNVPDFHNILLVKEDAVIVKTPDGRPVFTSKNFDKFMMQISSTHALFRSQEIVHQIDIYTTSYEWLHSLLSSKRT